MSTTKNKKAAFAGSSTRGPTNRTVTSRKGAPTSIDSQSRHRKSVYGGASRTVLSSSSRRNVLGAGDKLSGPSKPPVQVFDDEGRDVTPVPLLHMDPNAVRQKQSNLLADSNAGTPTDLMSQASIYQTGTVTASTFGGGPFTRSVFSASQSGRSTGSITDELGEPAPDMAHTWTESKVQYKREEVKEVLTEEDLERIVDINLTETETIWLLDLPGICVSLETEEAQEVQARNARYIERVDHYKKKSEESSYLLSLGLDEELVKSQAGNDRYMERGMNTFNEPPKFKHVQTSKVDHNSVGINASTWDMYDTYKELADKENAEKEAEEDVEGSASRPVSAAVQTSESGREEDGTKSMISRDGTQISMAKPGAESTASTFGTDSVFASKDSKLTSAGDEEEQDFSAILQSEELQRDLVTMERVVNLNSYQAKQAQYRGFNIYEDVDGAEAAEVAKPAPTLATQALSAVDLSPNLDILWNYQCPLTKGRNISCIAWNKINPDLLAVGYGQFDYNKQKGGLVCCWSLKNPEFPERVYTTAAGVTALDFSQAHPNLLAAGLYNGTVAIFNVSNRENETVLDSLKHMRSYAYEQDENEAGGKHTGPVWQLKWIEKERGSGEEKTEVMVSISTDGRVTQWSIRKGFESQDLMKLKRVNVKTQLGKVKKAEAFISRFAGGLCFDFSLKDSNIYIAGTEEGHIHRCSCSYNEQYLDSYDGHTGPVYALQWSPFCPDIFLSCSGDWSVRLWHQDRLQPILTFHSSSKSVPSICWSPWSSTVFACCNEGAIEIWDLSQSTLDPIVVTNTEPGAKLSCVTFSRNSDCLLIGGSVGDVIVAELKHMPPPPDNQEEALLKVIQSSLATQLESK